MKYSAVLSLAVAPLAIAKAAQNVYPQEKRTSHKELAESSVHIGGTLNLANGISLGGTTQVIVIWANPGANAETTTLHKQVTVTQTVTAGAEATTIGTHTLVGGATTTVATGAIATHKVQVGGPGGLIFVPDQVKANVGDMVVFEFLSQNHTATQSTFAEPCTPMEGGMDSGFQPNVNNTIVPAPQVAMQVMTTEPLWFFCKQGPHCGRGMTFSINPTAEKSQALFQAKAIQQNGNGDGSAITGNATSSAVTAAPAATATGAVTLPDGINVGQGVIENGACVCAVSCSPGSFPVAAQGVGSFGGMAGALPANMMETV
ncbi:Cupredoxin [Durotheca rogersii]|uniref:Cupredoxin n=1 Tax=Durotheca rogersii TaxID=419775 RepID=UPI002220D43B|nr:Cupredoxin [Durotheca rogersii]KAI5862355.1 Cupredoxin [Durotheca rogersii]